MRPGLKALIAGLALLAAAPPASAFVERVVAPPGSGLPNGLNYATPLVVTRPADPIDLLVLDPVAPHNVVAVGAYGPTTQSWCTQTQKKTNTCPLFWSETVSAGTSTPVLGVEHLKSGKAYDFVCTVHPVWMTGQLHVL